MRYQSTRNQVNGHSFKDVLMTGFAPDGGMYVPEVIPPLSIEELQSYSTLPYTDLCWEIVKKFVSEEECKSLHLHELIGKAFSAFNCKEIIPVKHIGDIYIPELWHGRTMAFKDLGVSCLGHFVENLLKQEDSHANVICATSGDTGSAVMNSVKGSASMDVFTMFPEGRCSELQERQMVCIEDENIHAFSTEGTSDDFDVVMADVFADGEFSKQHTMISFSSVNWTRILIQIVHFFFSYFQTVKCVGDPVTIFVPSGGLGNLTAGYIASIMGLPIKLVAAVNQNGATHRILSEGVFKEPDEVLKSISCSMDIAVPYNIERLMYLASNRDDTVSRIMKDFTESRSTEIPNSILCKLRETIQSATVSEEDSKDAIKSMWSLHGYHIDPHTAVAIAVAFNPERYGIKLGGEEIICLSCASPQKFHEVFRDLAIPLEPAEEVQHLLSKPKRFTQLRKGENWTQILKDAIVKATGKFEKSLQP